MNPGVQSIPAAPAADVGEATKELVAPPSGGASAFEATAFEQRCVAFLEAHTTRRDPATGASTLPGTDSPEYVRLVKRYQAALFDAGLAGLTWPREYGGQGLPVEAQAIFNRVARDFDVPIRVVGIGLGMCGPAIVSKGCHELKARYIAPLLRGDEVWCQLFSEPSAGSDVASLRTRADRDGDGWRVSGQKVWSSVAHQADFGMLLARTDADVPKHRGLSMFVLDMRSPGVSIRPIRQMDGGAHFNEVFLDDVFIPSCNLIGEVNGGWAVATDTLGHERVAVSGGRAGAARVFPSALALARRLERTDEPLTRDRLARLYIAERILALGHLRVSGAREAGRQPGPAGSTLKLLNAVVLKSAAALQVDLLGARATAWLATDEDARRAVDSFLSAVSASIGGGTDEVQRNTLGERVLGLPREPAVDRDVAFSELLRRTDS